MMSTLGKEKLTAKQEENTFEVMKILETFLKKSNSAGLSDTSDRETDYNNLTWLGWTVVNGTANDVAALIKSKLTDDPLLGMYLFTIKSFTKNYLNYDIELALLRMNFTNFFVQRLFQVEDFVFPYLD